MQHFGFGMTSFLLLFLISISHKVYFSVIQVFSPKLVLEWNFMNDIRHFSIVSKYFPNEGSKLT